MRSGGSISGRFRVLPPRTPMTVGSLGAVSVSTWRGRPDSGDGAFDVTDISPLRAEPIVQARFIFHSSPFAKPIGVASALPTWGGGI
jgi:hypothetical protein